MVDTISVYECAICYERFDTLGRAEMCEEQGIIDPGELLWRALFVLTAFSVGGAL